MPTIWRTTLITALIACAAGALGVYASLAFFADGGEREHTSLDEVVHRELGLSADQKRQIEEVEARFHARERSLEGEMRAATREIAAAVSEDKAQSPRVDRAVAHFHNAMGELQHETIVHIFEMRAVLTAHQQSRFDEIVRTELLRSSRDPPSD